MTGVPDLAGSIEEEDALHTGLPSEVLDHLAEEGPVIHQHLVIEGLPDHLSLGQRRFLGRVQESLEMMIGKNKEAMLKWDRTSQTM